MRLHISEHVEWEAFDAGAVNAHGNPAGGWLPAISVGIYAFNPGTTEDVQLAGHDRDMQAPSIYVPPSVVMGARDRVTVRGRLYEVDGATKEFRNPYSSRMDNNQIDLRRVEG